MANTDTNLNSPGGNGSRGEQRGAESRGDEPRRQNPGENEQSRREQSREPSPGGQSPLARDTAQRQRGRAGLPSGSSAWSGSPFASFMQLSQQMDNLMDSLFGRSLGRFGGGQGQPFGTAQTLFAPKIDVRRRGDHIVIIADLPGVAREDVSIECTDDSIAISGRREEIREENQHGDDYHFAERSYGSFYRSIPLPEGTQTDQANATMRNGVLEITVPLRADQQRRRIEIGG
jgi:HSP20 family protein